MSDPLSDLSHAGVSVWLDDLSRELLANGGLADLVASRHVVGVTTNPTIFAAALTYGERYESQLHDLARSRVDVDEAISQVVVADVQEACTVLQPVFESSSGLDGRVSIEVDPRLARNALETMVQARHLWGAVGRDNLFVKIPATSPGLVAIEDAIAEGISVNATLIFSLSRYQAVQDAFLRGLTRAQDRGADLRAIHSVASFFVSRMDVEVDSRLGQVGTPEALALRGQAAVANARLAFESFQQTIAGERWKSLEAAGANRQRPLWASTGVKNPAYPDTKYVSELVTSGTVNTMPRATLDAFADHGSVTGDAVRAEYGHARLVMEQLAGAGIDYDDVTDWLERRGLELFEQSWAELTNTVRTSLERLAA